MALARSPVPVVSIVIGEGGSGGALAMCAADYVGMLENSYLSVIAPEACASIIFRDSSRAAEAAEAMKITARDLKQQGIADEVLSEPLGGAHNQPEAAVNAVGEALDRVLADLKDTDSAALIKDRYERYRKIGTHAAAPSENGSHPQREPR
jgi:acetyl-CoA carboxylase carboxyl transferase subunit alpha